MRSAYGQVFRTYLRSPLGTIAWGTGCLFICATALLIQKITARGDFIGLELLLTVLLWSMVLWNHFRQLVVNSQLRLCPDFAGPQLASFIGFFLATIVASALILAPFSNASLPGAVSLIIAFFAVTGLVILTQSVACYLVSLIVLPSWGYLGSGLATVTAIYHGQLPAAAIATLLISLAIISVVLLCFFRLTEEYRIYHKGARGLSSLAIKPRMTGEGGQFWAHMPERGFRFYAGLWKFRSAYSANSKWGRIQRRRYQGSWKLIAMGVWMAAVTMLLPIFVFHHTTGTFPNFSFDQTMVLLPAIVSATWIHRWKYIEAELLMPIDRRIFFKELGLAMMLDFIVALVVSLVTLVLAAVWCGYVQTLPFLLNGLLRISAVILSFGFNAWSLRFRSLGSNVVNVFVLLPFAMLPIITNGPLQTGAYLPWVLTGMFAVGLIGCSTAWRGYQLWLETEIG